MKYFDGDNYRDVESLEEFKDIVNVHINRHSTNDCFCYDYIEFTECWALEELRFLNNGIV